MGRLTSGSSYLAGSTPPKRQVPVEAAVRHRTSTHAHPSTSVTFRPNEPVRRDLLGSLRYKLNARALINLFCVGCASTFGYVDFPCVTAVSELSWPKARIPWVLGPNAVVRSCAARSTMPIFTPSKNMPPNANASCMLVPKYAALSP